MADQNPRSGDVNISNINESDIDIGPIISGQVGGDVVGRNKITVYQTQPLPAAEKREQHDLAILLKNVETTWIEGVLEHSVHDAALLDLGKEIRADAVDHPWHMVLENPDRSRQPLPPDKNIKSIFDEANRLLLILGEPGSGKTTTLLQLARELIAEVRADAAFTQPVPVIFNLSTWIDKQQPLADWLIAELNSKYRTPKKQAHRWLEARRILPLLDGLDEVRPENRAACVEQINRLAVDYGLQGMVVCSRVKDYTALDVRLQFNRAIYLQPLTPEQIDAYLDHAGNKLTGLRDVLRRDKALQSLAQSPLMLNIMSLAYQDSSVEVLSDPSLDTDATRRQHLFETYIARMFKRKGDRWPYDADQTKARLSWLARNMQHHNQEVFLIEGLQPSWLRTGYGHWVYALGSRLIGWLTIALSIGLSIALLVWLNFGLINALLFGVIIMIIWLNGGLIGGLMDGLRFEYYRRNFVLHKMPPRWLLIANLLIYGLMGGLIFGSVGGLIDYNILFGLIGAFIFGLIYGLRSSRSNRRDDIQTTGALRWSWGGAIGGWGLGMIFGFSGRIIVDALRGVQVDMSDVGLGVIYGLIFALIGMIQGGLKGKVADTSIVANQGIKLSQKNAIYIGLFSGIGFGLFVAILFGPFSKFLFELIGIDSKSGLIEGRGVGLSWGFLFGILAALWYGGLDVLQHYTLRLILIIQGYTPRNYAHFLDHAVGLIFLQKVGGGYRFIHRLLLEHFAAMGGEDK